MAVPAGVGQNPRFKAARAGLQQAPARRWAENQAPLTPAQQEQYLKAAACIRSHGVPNFPDPTFSGGGVHIEHQKLNESSPAFKAAVHDCESLIPGGVHGGPATASRPRQPERGPAPQLSFRFACQHRPMRLLVVDDDPSVREALELVLDLNGFGVSTAADGGEAIRTLAVDRPDAVILDVLMPGLDGLEVCRRMRAIGDRTPVLMLTARAEVSERVAGLEAGADDYLVKPFASEELVARLRALLRRTGWEGNEETMRFEDLELDPLAHEARRDGRPLELTRTEFLLLELLMRHPVRCFRARRSSSACGAMTSGRPRTRWRCTSAICAARPRPAGSRAWCRRSGESATC